MSWNEFSQPVTDSKEAAEATVRRQKLEQAYRAMFATSEGQLVLEDLREKTIEKPCAPMQAVDGAAFNALSNIREGENNLYRYIVKMIKRGSNPS